MVEPITVTIALAALTTLFVTISALFTVAIHLFRKWIHDHQEEAIDIASDAQIISEATIQEGQLIDDLYKSYPNDPRMKQLFDKHNISMKVTSSLANGINKMIQDAQKADSQQNIIGTVGYGIIESAGYLDDSIKEKIEQKKRQYLNAGVTNEYEINKIIEDDINEFKLYKRHDKEMSGNDKNNNNMN